MAKVFSYRGESEEREIGQSKKEIVSLIGSWDMRRGADKNGYDKEV